MKKIVVGLSGGVDSSVAALLLQQQGYEIQALFMKNWEEDDDPEYCSAEVDLKDATEICNKLNIQLHARNFASEYWDKVFSYFIEEYRAGRTPNPDVVCNKEIKFKIFLEHALEMGADHIATGHYARIRYHDGYFRLYKAKDLNKDQTYFLYALGQSQLSRSWFPLGDLSKPEVRELAEKAGFSNYSKKDSTGICFIGERKFKDFLGKYLPAMPGDIKTPEGEAIGKHDGLMYYTLGQRQGLGIGGSSTGSGDAWYVAEKDLVNNVLIVVQGHDHPRLYKKTLMARNLNWITKPPSHYPFECLAKTRYRQPDQPCIITQLDNESCNVEFLNPQRAITPGQSVVFYSEDECLGGGVIQ
ncbi:tRNA 2-thiouridine(34) synthase MnmA [Kaarinaea lacus]